jgi:hypothetical protein
MICKYFLPFTGLSFENDNMLCGSEKNNLALRIELEAFHVGLMILIFVLFSFSRWGLDTTFSLAGSNLYLPSSQDYKCAPALEACVAEVLNFEVFFIHYFKFLLLL